MRLARQQASGSTLTLHHAHTVAIALYLAHAMVLAAATINDVRKPKTDIGIVLAFVLSPTTTCY